jgi:DNA-binding SARP family transcriptional activator/ABC-type oligopeptide transport system substrate-binding subunit
VEFRLLGPLEVLREDAKVVLGHAKQRTVLAVLLLHRGEVLSTERLIDELWGESPPATATKTVQVYVSHLRKALGDTSAKLLRTEPPGYVLDCTDADVDADRFEWLLREARDERDRSRLERAAGLYREALALWRGRALADLTFESFASNETERLNELRLEALTERVDCDLRLGRHADLVGELEALVGEHPLRESLRCQLMLALYRSGRQADALEVYIDARRALRDQLGLEPGPELRRLEQSILRQDDGLLRDPPPPTRPTASMREPHARRAVAVGVVAAACVLALAAFAATRGGSGTRRVQPNSVAVIDPRSGDVVADVPVGVDPGSIAAGFGSVWVGNLTDGTVSRIAPASDRVVRTITVGVPPRVLVPTRDGVVVGSESTVERIRPEFDDIATRLAINSGRPSGPSSTSIRQGPWLPTGDGVTEVDPAGRRIEDSIATGTGGAAAVAVGEGAVWAAQATDKAVVRIDRTRLLTPIRLANTPTGIAVGAGAVWVITTGDTLIRIDPAAAAVTATIPVGARPTSVAVGGGSVWVANALDGSVSQVDPRRDETIRAIHVGNSPQSVAWIDGKLWVAVQSAASLPAPAGTSGALRIETQLTDIGTLDPAVDFTTYGVQFDYATCLQLLNHPDAGAPTAALLKPEAARSLPAVSRDGRTYTFTVRKGFRFSPPSGERVTAETFRYAIERALNPKMRSYAAILFDDLAGFAAFEAGKTKHLSGVAVHGDRISIRLTHARPDFPERVATPFFCAVPIGTPVDPRGVREIPSAGPYFVASERPRQVVLERNSHYRGTRPHRLARIVLTLGVSQKRMLSDLQSGRADYALDSIPRSAIPRIDARYGPSSSAAAAGHQRYFEVTQPGVQYLVMNTQRPLFRHLRLRLAVNYAIDRATLASLGAPTDDPAVAGPQTPTDHYLPPGIPGYHDARTYPLRPDLRRARRLARGLGGTALMDSCDLDVCDRIAQTVRSNLKAIGIDVVVKRWSIGDMYTHESTPGARFDIGIAGWFGDYADPAAFLNPLFDGRSIADGSNTSRLDQRTWNRRLEAAATLTGRARERAYGALDLALTRQAAPAVPWSYRTRGAFFSDRVGCQIEQPVTYGVDLAALCIRQ